MSSFYHSKPTSGDPPPRDPREWLILSYCHARALGLPAGSVSDYCDKHLPLMFLGPRLTTKAVICSLMFPPPEGRD